MQKLQSHFRTHTPQQTAGLFLDHLVGGRQEAPRHIEAERLGGLHIDDELILGRRLNRKVSWLLAFEDAVKVACRAYVGVDSRRPVGEETATIGEIAERIDRRQPESSRKRDDMVSMRCCGGTSGNDQTSFRK